MPSPPTSNYGTTRDRAASISFADIEIAARQLMLAGTYPSVGAVHRTLKRGSTTTIADAMRRFWKDQAALNAGNPVTLTPINVSWDVSAAQKDGFPDFMSKEIREQPRAVADTLIGRLHADGSTDIEELGLTPERLRDIERVKPGAQMRGAPCPMAVRPPARSAPLAARGVAGARRPAAR